jgi:arylamine N-acetyltransferase
MIGDEGLFSPLKVKAVYEAVTHQELTRIPSILIIQANLVMIHSRERNGWYSVRKVEGIWSCSCPDSFYRKDGDKNWCYHELRALAKVTPGVREEIRPSNKLLED